MSGESAAEKEPSEEEMEFIAGARYGDLDDVKQALEAKKLDLDCTDYNGNTALQMAAGNGHAEVAEALLEGKADPDKPNKSGNTPLHWAALNGHLEVCKLLVGKGKAVTTITNEFGRRPFDEALSKNPSGSEVCEYLAPLTDMSKDSADVDEKEVAKAVVEEEAKKPE